MEENPAALIAELIEAFESLLVSDAFAESNGAFAPHDALAREIAQAMDELLGAEGAIQALTSGRLRGWWGQLQQQAAHRRARELYWFLGLLGREYASLPPLVVAAGPAHVALGQKRWIPLERTGPPKDNRSHFPALRSSGNAHVRYTPATAAFRTGFRAAGDSVRIRLHSLSAAVAPRFAGTEMMNVANKTHGFRLSSIDLGGNEADYVTAIRAAVREAAEQGVHWLCFPELSIVDTARAAIAEEMAAAPFPFAVLAGSNHVDRAGHRFNSGPLLVREGNGGVPFCWYMKREPFAVPLSDLEKDPMMTTLVGFCRERGATHAEEHIRRATHYTIFSTPRGLAAVVICKDVFAPDFPQLCRFVDHIFVLSLHDRKEWFEPHLSNLAKLHDVAFYYVNWSAAGAGGAASAGWVRPHERKFYYVGGGAAAAVANPLSPASYVDCEF